MWESRSSSKCCSSHKDRSYKAFDVFEVDRTPISFPPAGIGLQYARSRVRCFQRRECIKACCFGPIAQPEAHEWCGKVLGTDRRKEQCHRQRFASIRAISGRLSGAVCLTRCQRHCGQLRRPRPDQLEPVARRAVLVGRKCRLCTLQDQTLSSISNQGELPRKR